MLEILCRKDEHCQNLDRLSLHAKKLTLAVRWNVATQFLIISCKQYLNNSLKIMQLRLKQVPVSTLIVSEASDHSIKYIIMFNLSLTFSFHQSFKYHPI